MNDSSTGGFLTEVAPVAPDDLEDDSLANLFQSLIVGLTGIAAGLVRPRWQMQPPTQPPATTNWCSIGVTTVSSIDYPEIIHNSENGGSDTLFRLERLEVLASFYGPDSSDNAGILRDGLYVDQNYSILAAAGVKLRSADDITHAPELINAQYISRSDLPMTFMRMVDRTYPVKNIVGTGVNTFLDNGDSCHEDIQQP